MSLESIILVSLNPNHHSSQSAETGGRAFQPKGFGTQGERSDSVFRHSAVSILIAGGQFVERFKIASRSGQVIVFNGLGFVPRDAHCVLIAVPQLPQGLRVTQVRRSLDQLKSYLLLPGERGTRWGICTSQRVAKGQ